MEEFRQQMEQTLRNLQGTSLQNHTRYESSFSRHSSTAIERFEVPSSSNFMASKYQTISYFDEPPSYEYPPSYEEAKLIKTYCKLKPNFFE